MYLNFANEMETKGKFKFGQVGTHYKHMIGTSINIWGLMRKMEMGSTAWDPTFV